MHCNSNYLKGAFFTVVTMLLFSACHPDTSGNLSSADDNGGYASDASRIEWANNDIISIADAAGYTYNGAYMRTTHITYDGTCALVGTDTNSTPHTLTIYFGNSDCVCLDNRKRRGTIIVKYNGEYTDPSQLHTITFDNYFVNDNQVFGTIQTSRVDTTITGNWYYNVWATDSMNVSQDPLNSQIESWIGTFTRKWVSGFLTTDDRNDDVYSISGSAILTRPNSHVFNFNISTPLQVSLNCNFIEIGVVNITGYTGARRLDYGSGSCDAAATIYEGVNSYPITLAP